MSNEKLTGIRDELGNGKWRIGNRYCVPLFPIPYSLFPIIIIFMFPAFIYGQSEEQRFNTIKYGTETEIAALIQSLKNEGADYLDNEIIALTEKTRNNKILGGAFSFFSEREKKGLEGRAIRAIEEREDEDNETVLAAIDYIGKIKAADSYKILLDLLESAERRFMNSAISALGRISGPDSGLSEEAALYLIDYGENHDINGENRREIIIALGVTGSAAAVEFLSGIAGDGDERAGLRIAALEALEKLGNEVGLNTVLACISASDPNIRAAAVRALGPFSGDAVDEAILDAFRDSFYRTRIAAAQASRQRRLAKAVPFLKFRAENDEVPQVKEEAIKALGAIADAESMKFLEEIFIDRKKSVSVRIVAGEMLMQKTPEKFLDSFIKELDEAKEKNQTALYNGLLKIIGGTKCAGLEPFALRLIGQKGVVEKSYAMDIAANNNLKALADEIKTIAEDKNEGMARKAKRTLEKLGIVAP